MKGCFAARLSAAFECVFHVRQRGNQRLLPFRDRSGDIGFRVLRFPRKSRRVRSQLHQRDGRSAGKASRDQVDLWKIFLHGIGKMHFTVVHQLQQHDRRELLGNGPDAIDGIGSRRDFVLNVCEAVSFAPDQAILGGDPDAEARGVGVFDHLRGGLVEFLHQRLQGGWQVLGVGTADKDEGEKEETDRCFSDGHLPLL